MVKLVGRSFAAYLLDISTTDKVVMMARLTPHARREAIIDAALVVARRKGIGATTARDVAAEMHTSSGLIHHYFSSMDDLLAAAFAKAADVDLDFTDAAVAAVEGGIAKLGAFFASYEQLDGDWGYQLWFDAWSEAARHPVLQQTSQRLNLTWQHRLRSIIIAGVDEGVFTCPDADAVAWRVLSMLDGLALQVVAHPDALKYEVVMPWSMQFAETELGLPSGTLRLAGCLDE